MCHRPCSWSARWWAIAGFRVCRFRMSRRGSCSTARRSTCATLCTGIASGRPTTGHPHLDDEIALAESSPPQQISGDPITALADAVSCVPDRALPVVITTWSLSRFSPERRRRFVHALGEVSSARRTAWVSVEGGVGGVVPTIPTLGGDRPVSGHSIIGLTVFEPSTALPRFDVAGDALGRCWSRGRFMSWFA